MGCKQCKQNEQTEGLKLSVKAKKANSDKFIEKSTNLDSIQTMMSKHILHAKQKQDKGGRKEEENIKLESKDLLNLNPAEIKKDRPHADSILQIGAIKIKSELEERKKYLSIDSQPKDPGGLAMPKFATTVAGKSQKRLKVDIANFRKAKTGSVMEHYNVLEHLGNGAFGVVKRVEHIHTKQIRALKIIAKNKFVEEMDPKTEFEILKQLDHPNILRLFEYYEDMQNYYLIMEICVGGELFKRILTLKNFSERRAAFIVFQVLSAISYCHDKNIVHRDIKPENLLLETDDIDSIIKVIDFGASRMFKENEPLKERFGTPYYIAPEVIRGKYNEKCDLWSTGVIAYILLCGKPPFNGNNNKQILQKVMRGTYTFQSKEWTFVSKEAKQFIQNLLVYNPEKRFSATEALNDPWIIKMTSNVGEILRETALSTFNNLSQFSAEQRLQEAVLGFMVTHMQEKDEEAHLLQIFQAFDSNKDGQLSREELIAGYSQLFGDELMAEIEVDRIIEQVDVNHNGLVDYSEFLMANASLNTLLSDEKLKVAFQEFDLDGNGEITLDELKQFLGSGDEEEENEDYWKEIIAEVDQDGDGQVNFHEFKSMMKMLCSDSSPISGILSPGYQSIPSKLCSEGQFKDEQSENFGNIAQQLCEKEGNKENL